jgi:hypothetical protein
VLLDYNADINSKCKGGWTPFPLAIEGGSVAVMQILLDKEFKMDNRYKLVRISKHM